MNLKSMGAENENNVVTTFATDLHQRLSTMSDFDADHQPLSTNQGGKVLWFPRTLATPYVTLTFVSWNIDVNVAFPR